MKKGYVSAALIATTLAFSGCAVVGQQSTGDDFKTRPQAIEEGDAKLEHRLLHLMLQGDYRYEQAHLNVDAFNGYVLLTGQVPNQELKDMAGAAVKRQPGVNGARNELTVGDNTTRSQRIKDSWITTRLDTKLLVDNTIQSDSVHVVTENGVVYLMGSVSQEASQRIAAAAGNIDGVQRVVKVFQYID